MVLPNVNCSGFSHTNDARTIQRVIVTDAPIVSQVMCKVAVKVAPVATYLGYHTTGACVIHGIAVTDATDDARSGYHYYNSCLGSRHGRVGESTSCGCGVNVLWQWVPCNK